MGACGEGQEGPGTREVQGQVDEAGGDRRGQENRARRARQDQLKGREAIELEYKGRPWGDIKVVRTEHYEIWCNSTEEVAKGYGTIMEALHDKYSSVFQNFEPTRKGRGIVRIHRNHRQFMDWTGNGPYTGGFCNIFTTDVTAYHGSFGTTGTTYEVLAHEGTHQFELSSSRRWCRSSAPAWGARACAFCPLRWRDSHNTPGRKTCASSRTPWSE